MISKIIVTLSNEEQNGAESSQLSIETTAHLSFNPISDIIRAVSVC